MAAHSSSPSEPSLAPTSSGSELRALLLLAGPNIMAHLAETMLSLVDFAIVSQLGPEAQAAVSSGAMVFFSGFAFLIGLLFCVTTMVSQSLGANRLGDCGAYAWQGIWLSLLFGGVGVVMWPLVPAIFQLINHEHAVQQMEVSYTRIRFLSIGAAGAAIAIGNYFNGIHRPHINTISVVAANVINGVLSYALVLGAWGLPALGVAGAAIGTLIASLLRLLFLIIAMCMGADARRYETSTHWQFDLRKTKRLLKIGVPSGAALTSDITGWAAFLAGIIGMFGTIHLAATATCWRFTELSFMPALGIGAAVTTMVGKAIGEGNRPLARRRARLGTQLNMVYMGCMGLVYVLFGEALIDVFSDEPAVITLGAEILIFVAVFQVFDAVGLTYGHALRGAGDTTWPAVVGAVECWGIMILGSLWIAHARPELESRGPWAMATLYVLILGGTLWLRWRSTAWEGIDAIGRDDPPLPPIEPGVPEHGIADTALASGQTPASDAIGSTPH